MSGVINHGMSLSVLYIDSIELYWFNFCVCNFQIESEWSLMNSNAADKGWNSNDCLIGEISVICSTSNQINKFYLKSVHFITVQHKLSRAFQTDMHNKLNEYVFKKYMNILYVF
jgi:hypothetical protein